MKQRLMVYALICSVCFNIFFLVGALTHPHPFGHPPRPPRGMQFEIEGFLREAGLSSSEIAAAKPFFADGEKMRASAMKAADPLMKAIWKESSAEKPDIEKIRVLIDAIGACHSQEILAMHQALLAYLNTLSPQRRAAVIEQIASRIALPRD